MVDKPTSDMVMRFVQNGKSVLAECTLEKDPKDTYMDGFTPQTYTRYSNFFEVTNFNFGVKITDEDKTKANLQGGVTKQETDHAGKSAKLPKKAVGLVAGAFASWRAASSAEAPKVPYPLDFDEFEFERLIDAASTSFFTACCLSRSFESAVLVKRVSMGGGGTPWGFMRVVFKDVLIISLRWDDGDLTKEKCKFICRQFTLSYRQQKADGSFSAEVGADWDFKRDSMPR